MWPQRKKPRLKHRYYIGFNRTTTTNSFNFLPQNSAPTMFTFSSVYIAASREVQQERGVLFFWFHYFSMNINTFRLVTQLFVSPLGLRMLPLRTSTERTAYRKDVLAVLISNRREVLALAELWRQHPESSRKKLPAF